jgi:hypothetical protein
VNFGNQKQGLSVTLDSECPKCLERDKALREAQLLIAPNCDSCQYPEYCDFCPIMKKTLDNWLDSEADEIADLIFYIFS